MALIDKDQVIAEIERIRSEAVMASFGNDSDWLRSRVATCVDILAILDTLEQSVEKTSYDTQKYTPSSSVSIEDVARVQFASHAKVFDKKRKAVFDWDQFKEVASIFYGFGKNGSPEAKEKEKPVELEKEIDDYIEGCLGGLEGQEIASCARHFAKWGAEHLKQ